MNLYKYNTETNRYEDIENSEIYTIEKYKGHEYIIRGVLHVNNQEEFKKIMNVNSIPRIINKEYVTDLEDNLLHPYEYTLDNGIKFSSWQDYGILSNILYVQYD